MSLIGKGPIVLYFYPKDDTPGCTKEACGIRDEFSEFRKLDATVFGISYDSIESHKKFIEKFKLPFALLSDSTKSIAKAYGANGLLMPKRQTFIVDRAGRIAWIQRDVSPAGHANELKEVIAKIQK